ncbi:MAG: helix-turn-helix domain-containing protein [Armatimonadota bacterium]
MFRDRFLEALNQSGMTQAALARELRVSPSTVSKWAAGLRVPRNRYWRRIEEVLGYPRAWFYAEDDGTAATLELARLRRQTEALLEQLKALQAEPMGPAATLRVPLLGEPPVMSSGDPPEVEGWVDLPLALLEDAAGVERERLYALRVSMSVVVEGKAADEAVAVIAPGVLPAEGDLFAYRAEGGEVLAMRYRRGLPLDTLQCLGRIVSVCTLP